MSTEEMYVKHINNGLRAIRLGTKTPSEAKLGSSLNKLKELNEGLYCTLLKQYIQVKKDYDIKNKN